MKAINFQDMVAISTGAASGIGLFFAEKYGIRCVCLSPGPVLTGADMANMKTLLGRAIEMRAFGFGSECD